MINAEFAKTNEEFLKACEIVAHMDGYKNFKPSIRQVSRWRNQKGIAWKSRKRVQH